MKLPGRIYHSNSANFLAVYNYFPDVYSAIPDSVTGKTERIAHVTYMEGNRSRGIDVFLLKGELGPFVKKTVNGFGKKRTVYSSPNAPEIDFSKPRTPDNSVSEIVDLQQGVEYALVNMDDSLRSQILQMIRTDIHLFCKRPAAKNTSSITTSSVLIPSTEVQYIEARQLVVPGKKEFIPGCKLEGNLDPGKGCIAGWIPGENAHFDGKQFTDFYLYPQAECTYCYAIPKHKTFPKTLFKIERGRLVEELLGKTKLRTGSDEEHGKPINILRLGKRTEFGSVYTREALVTTLEACIETGTRAVMPTKFLEYDPLVAELLRRSNSSILYSIGVDKEELGPLKFGFDNQFRLEQMAKYAQAKVNSGAFLMVPSIFDAPTQRELEVIEFCRKYNVSGVQLLPARYTSKEVCNRMTGHNWSDLSISTGHPHQLTFEGKVNDHHGTCKVHAGVLIPQTIHNSWLQLVNDNRGFIKMCHHTENNSSQQGKTWCGTCHTSKGFIMPTISVVKEKINRPKRGEKRGEDGRLFTKL